MIVGGKHNKGCCNVSCVIGSDTFNRINNNSLGTKWVEKSGDFDISDNTLVTVTEGICLTSYRQSNPRGNGYHYQVIVELVVATSSEWGLICKYTDVNNFDWVEFYIDGGTHIFPRFWRRTGGVDDLKMDITTHPAGVGFPIISEFNVQVEMCYSGVGWTVEGSSEMERWTTCDVEPAMSLPADTTVGFVGFKKGDFDNWVYNMHRLSNLPCPVCDCLCENPLNVNDYKCISEELVLTLRPTAPFTDPFGGCPPGGDVMLTLRQSEPSGVIALTTPTYVLSPRKLEWYSDVLYFPSVGAEMWFLLQCFDGQLRLHSLEYPGSYPAIGSGGIAEWLGTPHGTYQLPDSIQCTPIIIHYETLRRTNHDDGVSVPYCDTLPDLDYEAIITEP